MKKRDASERTKSEILTTAARLFAEKGWDKVNIEDVVKEIGFTRGAFYHHFKSREDLIYAVIVHTLEVDNPFELVAKETGLNALEKLRRALRLRLRPQVGLPVTEAVEETMYEPTVFKGNVFFSLNVIAPCIEALIVEGNADGSMSVEYPKQVAHVAALLCNEWLNPIVFQMTEQDFSDRLSFLEQLGEKLGVPLVNEEVKDVLRELYEKSKKA